MYFAPSLYFGNCGETAAPPHTIDRVLPSNAGYNHPLQTIRRSLLSLVM